MATNLNFCTSSEQATLAACIAAKGGPQTPQNLTGSGSPEGEIVGYWTGLDQYWDSTGNVLYRFEGVVGAATPWTAV